MVNSKLNPEINYIENKGLDPEDLEFDAQPWEVTMLGEDITIALGNPKYKFVKKNIIYYPIYLIKNNKVDTQIGIYEIISNQLASLLDEGFSLDAAAELLIYPLFPNDGNDSERVFTKQLIQKYIGKSSKDELFDLTELED